MQRPSPDVAQLPAWRVAADSFRAWADGDERAIDELVTAMTPVLWQVVRAYRLDEDSAKDVVQTTWLTFMRMHPTIADPQAVSAWLITSARREAWRVARVGSKTLTIDDETMDVAAAPVESAEDTATLQGEHSALWRAVATLTERCQRLLRIIAFDERPDYLRIAEDLEMPVGSIGPTRNRCLAKLKTALGGAS